MQKGISRRQSEPKLCICANGIKKNPYSFSTEVLTLNTFSHNLPRFVENGTGVSIERRKENFAMEPYAVVESGSKQYRVKAGDELNVELLDVEAGKQVELSPVLAVSNGTDLTVGAPAIATAKVTATVIKHFKGEKIVAFKIKRRKGYSRKVGHRQNHTLLKVDKISA